MRSGIGGRGELGRFAWLGWLLVVLVAAWLLWMTLRPNQTVASDLAPLVDSAADQGISSYILIDLAGNVVVFAPLGAAFAVALYDRATGQRLLLATVGGAALSLVIELIQVFVPSRVTALDDWLLNTSGAFLGAVVGCTFIRGRRD